MHGVFNNLNRLFDRVGLRMNVGKTFRMVCRPFQTAGSQSYMAYERQMTGEDLTYQEI